MRFAVFGVTALLTATLVVFVWIAGLSRYPVASLPHAALERLQHVSPDPHALAERAFAGFIRSDTQVHWVRLSGTVEDRRQQAGVAAKSPQPVRLEMTLADGSGSPTFAGWVDPQTGEMHMYIEMAWSRFSKFRRVDGHLTGPALVNGVPTLYLEASLFPTQGVATDEPSRWVGHLVVQESP